MCINHIKSKLKSYFWQHFVTNFDSDNKQKLHYLCLCGSCIHHSSRSIIIALMANPALQWTVMNFYLSTFTRSFSAILSKVSQDHFLHSYLKLSAGSPHDLS